MKHSIIRKNFLYPLPHFQSIAELFLLMTRRLSITFARLLVLILFRYAETNRSNGCLTKENTQNSFLTKQLSRDIFWFSIENGKYFGTSECQFNPFNIFSGNNFFKYRIHCVNCRTFDKCRSHLAPAGNYTKLKITDALE